MHLRPLPVEYVVGVLSVYDKVSKVNLNKAVGPGGIPIKLLELLPNTLEPPLADIINCSLR